MMLEPRRWLLRTKRSPGIEVSVVWANLFRGEALSISSTEQTRNVQPAFLELHAELDESPVGDAVDLGRRDQLPRNHGRA